MVKLITPVHIFVKSIPVLRYSPFILINNQIAEKIKNFVPVSMLPEDSQSKS